MGNILKITESNFSDCRLHDWIIEQGLKSSIICWRSFLINQPSLIQYPSSLSFPLFKFLFKQHLKCSEQDSVCLTKTSYSIIKYFQYRLVVCIQFMESNITIFTILHHTAYSWQHCQFTNTNLPLFINSEAA